MTISFRSYSPRLALQRNERLEHGFLLQHFGEQHRLSPRWIENVHRYAGSAKRRQRAGDIGIAARPVGAHERDVLARKRRTDVPRIENETLVHLAGDAPRRG